MNNVFLKKIKAISLSALMLALVPVTSFGAGPKLDLEDAKNSIHDTESLQRGAVLFANMCMSCHSVKYMRYNRVAKDLGWTDKEVLKNLNKTSFRAVDNMMGGMYDEVAMAAFGTKVPDLSLMARLKGTDYIYSFLRSFELNKEKGKWDNKLLPGTIMPNIMPKPQNTEAMAAYDEKTRDIANFLEYVGEPAKLKRENLGWKVMLFLFIMFFFVYFLKREYWKDIKH